ncbi:MAG: SUMF1/EgtB/PvdO family nonheme iron enzyme [Kiritimatiellae bacterium]|nr:SUMF1/EgtB/PvdO family nonheme iron enzyme [Kiritimatiellia bacterium]
MTFMSCPAGTFTMGYPDGRHEFFPHKVTITRPFWMSKYHVSGVQYNRMGQPIRIPQFLREAREALGGDKAPQIGCTINDILSFAEWMTEKYRNVLPNGYIIRPPTMAEWEYACRAGGNIENDWYAKPHLSISEKSKYAWTFEERWEILKKKGVVIDYHNPMIKSPWYFLPPSLSEQKPLNAWGIGDLYGNVYPLFLDTFPQSFAGRSEGDFEPGKPNWSGMNTDPLFWCDDPDAAVVSQRDTEKGWGELRHFIRRELRFPSNGFRLVIGPDLVKEKKEGRTATTAVGDNRSTGVNLPQTQKPELETGEKKQPSDLSNKPITVDMGMGRTMEFMACPAGTFNMGYQYASQYCFYLHKVTITRPFWIGKFPVTVDQWMRVASRIEVPQESRPVLTALGGDILPQTCCSRDEAGAFASRMNILFKKYLPAGYVFRLPTMAEWEYACRANGDVTSDWFAKPLLSEDEQKRYAITPQEKLTVLTRKGITGDKIKQQVASYYSIPFPVGTKPANRWGVCDLLGNVNEWMLDTFPATTYSTNPDMRWTSVGWLRNDRDPLFWATAKDFDGCFHANCRCEGWGTKRFMIKRSTKNPSIGFRLVVGPDLVKEQKRGASK